MTKDAETLETYSGFLWDYVIIGAGPAGAMAAYLLAQRKQSVLLIDQSDFPRKKVCGGCFSSRALHELKLAGLEKLPQKLGAKPLHSLRLFSGKYSAQIAIPEGASLSRKQFDFALIQEAQKNGAIFFSKTKGVLKKETGPDAKIQLFQSGKEFEARAKAVLVCDGLLGESLKNFPTFQSEVSSGSLLGISACVPQSLIPVESGIIFMACGEAGYAGVVRQDNDEVEIAAAIKASALKAAGSPGACAEKTLSSAGLQPSLNLQDIVWQGTAPLSRKRIKLAGPRFFILGDASGYVEPFTGEGIYWSLLQARKLVSLLQTTNFIWDEKLQARWQKLYSEVMSHRKKICRMITLTLRHPCLCRMLISLLNNFPGLAAPWVKFIHGAADEK